MPDESFRTVIESLARTRSSSVGIFSDFCRLAACCVAAGTREPEYLEVARGYSRDELNEFSRGFALLVEEMEAAPFTDMLGPYYLDIAAHSSKQARGEFFTPPEISKLIARMVFDPEAIKAEGKPITLNEPACGSGGMVLATAELFAPDSVDLLRVTAQDINPVAADMCYLNLTLWGIPARVIRGDTIRRTASGDWRNIHWFRVGEEERQMIQRLQEAVATESEPELSIDLGSFRAKREVGGQFEMDLF